MKNIYMTLRISALMILALLMIKSTAIAQEEATQDTTVQEAPKDRPVRPGFESGLLFDATTTTVSPSKTLEFVLQHRFGYMDTEKYSKDFFGIWGASNIRVGLNYSFTDKLTVGIGTTKMKRLQDLQTIVITDSDMKLTW